MSQPGVRVAVVGATGALGAQLIEILERAPFPIERLVPIASAASVVPTLSFRGEDKPVALLDGDGLEGVDVIFSALPVDQGGEILSAAASAGCLVVDLSGHWSGDASVPLVALGVNAQELASLGERRVVRAPGPLVIALTAIGAALSVGSPVTSISGTALLPASARGRAGVEELAGQVVAMFNSREPPRATFVDGLAFDLIPAAEPVAADGWTLAERRISQEVSRILELSPGSVNLTRVLASMFVGFGLSLRVTTAGGLSVDGARVALEHSPALRLEDEPRQLMPRGLAGQATLSVGRIRGEGQGEALHLWAAGDPLRLTAANAVTLAAAVLEREAGLG